MYPIQQWKRIKNSPLLWMPILLELMVRFDEKKKLDTNKELGLWTSLHAKCKHHKLLTQVAWQATIYLLWFERNSRLHRQKFRTTSSISKQADVLIINHISSFCSATHLSLRSPRWFKFGSMTKHDLLPFAITDSGSITFSVSLYVIVFICSSNGARPVLMFNYQLDVMGQAQKTTAF